MVQKEVTKKLNMNDKVMTALKETGEMDSDLGILMPKEGTVAAASKVKAEKPSLDKLLATTKNLKSAYMICLIRPITQGMHAYEEPI